MPGGTADYNAPTTMDSFIMMFGNFVLYAILTWYFDHVLNF